MMHQFLYFNPSKSPEQTSLLSIMMAPNMVASYITTGQKHKMTAPNKGTALRGSMDVCPNNTLAWQLRLLVKNIHTNEHHVRAMKPRQPRRTEGMFVFVSGATVKGSGETMMSAEDILKPHSTATTVCSLLHMPLSTVPHNNCYGGISHRLWIQ